MYKVVNKTKQRTMGWRVERAGGFWTRLKGLLGRKNLTIGSGLILCPCNSIHSFFMQFSFDAVFLDRDDWVIHLVQGMKPAQVIKPVRGAFQVIELPAGSVKMTGTELGDKINICRCK